MAKEKLTITIETDAKSMDVEVTGAIIASKQDKVKLIAHLADVFGLEPLHLALAVDLMYSGEARKGSNGTRISMPYTEMEAEE